MKQRLSLLLILGLYLGCHKGYLALMDTDKEAPLQIYPCPVSSLPSADQAALERGIPVKNEKELAHRLEDFLS